MRREAISGAATARDKNCNRIFARAAISTHERSRRLFSRARILSVPRCYGRAAARDATELTTN
jgi:hypothetical protein